MKKAVIRFVRVALTVLILFLFLLFSKEVTSGVSNGLNVCALVLIPSLFPFLILSHLLVHSKLGKALQEFSAPFLTRWFGLPACCASAIIMGLIGGYPAGAQVVAQMQKQGEIDQATSQRLLWLCVNAGPSFLITALGVGILGDARAGLILYLAQILSVFVIGFILGRFFPLQISRKSGPVKNALSFGDALVHSVKGAIDSMLSVCGYVLAFSALISILEQTSVSLFPMIALLEVTLGCTKSAVVGAPLWWYGFLTSFAGLSVHMQVLSFFPAPRPAYLSFLLSRIAHGVCTAFLTGLLLIFFPHTAQVALSLSQPVANLSGSPLFSLILMMMCGVFLLSFPQKSWRSLD